MIDEFREWPRKDTLRSKKKMNRRVRGTLRYMNKSLRKGVFGDRFSVTLVRKEIRPYEDNSGWNSFFVIEFRDAEDPSRNFQRVYGYEGVIYSGLFCGGDHVDKDLNNFIRNSGFWDTQENLTVYNNDN